MSRIPSIPPSRDRNPTLDKVRELLNIWKGDAGNRLDRVVTVGDLLGIDVASLNTNGILSPSNTNTDFTPSPLYVGPLTDLVANGGFRLVFLSWSGINQANYAYTEIWRATEDNLANAVLVGTAIAGLYADQTVNSGQDYYYWVRAISTTGHASDFNATAGTLGTAVLEPDYVIGLIEGLISESELAAELLTPIQSIPSIQSTLDSHSISIPSIQSLLDSNTASINAIEASLNDIVISEFDANIAYDIGDVFKYNGTIYQVTDTQTPPNATPPNASYYLADPDYSTLQDAVNANATAITALDARTTATEDGITSQASNIAAIEANANTLNDSITANANAISGIDSRVTVTEGDIAGQAASIASQASDIVSISSSIDAINGDLIAIDDVVSGNSDAISLLTTRVTASESEITAISSDVTQLQADVQNLDASGNAQAISELDARVTANADDITAISSDITTISASVGDNTAAVQTKAEASVVASIDGTIQNMLAEYVLKLDNNGRVTGIGLMNDGTTSEFIVASDAVYFIDPDQSPTPFDPATNYASLDALRNSQFVFGYAMVEGQNRFAINVPAYIPDATITTAQMQTATINHINSLVINSLEGWFNELNSDISFTRIDNVMRANIKDARVETLMINGNAITIPLYGELMSDVDIDAARPQTDIFGNPNTTEPPWYQILQVPIPQNIQDLEIDQTVIVSLTGTVAVDNVAGGERDVMRVRVRGGTIFQDLGSWKSYHIDCATPHNRGLRTNGVGDPWMGYRNLNNTGLPLVVNVTPGYATGGRFWIDLASLGTFHLNISQFSNAVSLDITAQSRDGGANQFEDDYIMRFTAFEGITMSMIGILR